MNISFESFIEMLVSSPLTFISVLISVLVIIVNGWTDAPNAIATLVSTRSMSPRGAVALAACGNFLGVLVMSFFHGKVTSSIYLLADFSGDRRPALYALIAALFAIVLWSGIAWYFGIPTSESHGLIAGLLGAAIALQGGGSAINTAELLKVFSD